MSCCEEPKIIEEKIAAAPLNDNNDFSLDHGVVVTGPMTPTGIEISSLMRSLILTKLSTDNPTEIMKTIVEIFNILLNNHKEGSKEYAYALSIKHFMDSITHTDGSDKHFILPTHITDASSIFKMHLATDAQCYLWLHERVVYLIFKGSHVNKDFIFDGESKPELMDLTRFDENKFSAGQDGNEETKTVITQEQERQHNQISFHRGICKLFISISEKIEGEINKIGDEHYDTIICTGHGLGGAMATLAAVYYSCDYPAKIIHCHSFGAPRFGNQAFSDYCDFQHYSPLTATVEALADVALSGEAKVVAPLEAHHSRKLCRVYNQQDDVPCYPANKLLVHVASESLCLTNEGSAVAFSFADHNLRSQYDTSYAKYYAHEQHDIIVYIKRLGVVDMKSKLLLQEEGDKTAV